MRGFTLPKYKIFWYINSLCNYKCSYCIRKNQKGINNLIEPFLISRVCENLRGLNSEEYEFVISGGEPTLYPDLKGFIGYLHDEMPDSKIKISTNGFRGSDYFRDFREFKDFLEVRVSIHLEYVSSNKQILPLLITFQSFGFKYFADILYDRCRKDLMVEFVEKIRVNGLRGRVKLLEPKNQYFPEELELAAVLNRELGYTWEEIPVRNKKYCLTGSHKIEIDENGNYSVLCPHSDKNGNIYFLSPNKFRDSLFEIKKCPLPFCYCGRYLQPIQSDNREELIEKFF